MSPRYLTDGDARHLVCYPFSVEGLHAMARDLGINRCWFHNGGGGRFPHYDVPVRRVGKLGLRVELVTSRELLDVVKGGQLCQR